MHWGCRPIVMFLINQADVVGRQRPRGAASTVARSRHVRRRDRPAADPASNEGVTRRGPAAQSYRKGSAMGRKRRGFRARLRTSGEPQSTTTPGWRIGTTRCLS